MAQSYTVKQGDTLLSIAHAHRYSDPRLIYDHARNAELRALRPDPNTLFPGDVVFLPDKVPETFLCRTEHAHTFRLRRATARLEIVLEDEDGRPFAATRYKLTVGDLTVEARTGGDGLVQHDVPADAATGEITLWPAADDPERRIIWSLALGHLDPITEVSGVQARLANLGFDPGPVDGAESPALEAALRQFQRTHELPVTGARDGATLRLLHELHEQR
jgi:N-acetylmuramoyl-L-alanine amidase